MLAIALLHHFLYLVHHLGQHVHHLLLQLSAIAVGDLEILDLLRQDVSEEILPLIGVEQPVRDGTELHLISAQLMRPCLRVIHAEAAIPGQ